jgi:hypothetical protein
LNGSVREVEKAAAKAQLGTAGRSSQGRCLRMPGTYRLRTSPKSSADCPVATDRKQQPLSAPTTCALQLVHPAADDPGRKARLKAEPRPFDNVKADAACISAGPASAAAAERDDADKTMRPA